MPSQSIQVLARQVLTREASSRRATNSHNHEAVRVCEKLKVSLTRFAGADGFSSLLRRSLALARAQVHSLNQVTLQPDCSLDGLEALAAKDPQGGVKAGAAIVSHLFELLVTFIGESLTLRLLRESWPDVSLEESDQEN